MTHFIKLPDGTIINTALVTYVDTETHRDTKGIVLERYAIIYFPYDKKRVNDPTGAIYAYFDNIATAIVAAEDSTDDDTELGW